MLSKEYEPEIYDLPGTKVEVHQPFGSTYYYAIANIYDCYPEPGKIAHDIGRREYMHLLEGDVTLTLNNASYVLKQGLARLVDDGDYYFIEGKGKLMVFVEDQEKGTTQIEDLKDIPI